MRRDVRGVSNNYNWDFLKKCEIASAIVRSLVCELVFIYLFIWRIMFITLHINFASTLTMKPQMETICRRDSWRMCRKRTGHKITM